MLKLQCSTTPLTDFHRRSVQSQNMFDIIERISVHNGNFSQQDVKYFSLNSAEEVMKLFKEELLQDDKMVEDEEENEEHWSDLGTMTSSQSYLSCVSWEGSCCLSSLKSEIVVI